jgi:hypothetical protein
MRIVHNINQEEIVEEVGRSMPRIYVALDKKQED